MRASSKRILSVLLALGFFIGALFIFGNFIKPAYGDIQKRRGALQSRRQIFNQHQVAVNQVQQLIQEYQGLAQLRDALSLSIPIGQDASFLIAQWQGIAQAAGLSVQSLNFVDLPVRASPLSLVKGLGIVQIQARVYGSYGGMKTFLSGLESNVRIMNVGDLRIEPTAPGKDIFNMIITVDAYYQPKQ